MNHVAQRGFSQAADGVFIGRGLLFQLLKRRAQPLRELRDRDVFAVDHRGDRIRQRFRVIRRRHRLAVEIIVKEIVVGGVSRRAAPGERGEQHQRHAEQRANRHGARHARDAQKEHLLFHKKAIKMSDFYCLSSLCFYHILSIPLNSVNS